MQNYNQPPNIDATNVCATGAVRTNEIEVRRQADFRGNVRIDGWLDAPNIVSPCKGLFADAQALFEAYPSPMPGWWALVGTNIPVEIYRVEHLRWHATGETISDIDITGHTISPEILDEIEALHQAIRRIETELAGVPQQVDRVEERVMQIMRDYKQIADIDTEFDEDASLVRLKLLDSEGRVIAGCEIPALGGSGGSSEATKLVLVPEVSAAKIKDGGRVTLTYRYDMVYVAGDDAGVSTGQRANITVRVVNGATTLYENVTNNVAAGTYTLDLSGYVQPGVNGIYVIAQWVDPSTGELRPPKQKYTQVQVVALTLRSSYDLGEVLGRGGYTDEMISIPYTVAGAGDKYVWLYVDGEERAHDEVSVTAPTTGEFLLNAATLSAGVHTVEMVATMEVTSNSEELRSESIFFTIFKGVEGAVVVVKVVNDNGELTGEPRMGARRFEPFTIEYGAYDPGSAMALVTIESTAGADATGHGGSTTVRVGRTKQVYNGRFTTSGEQTVTITCGGYSQQIVVDVERGGITVSEAPGAKCKLSARGRSNSESAETRSTWSDSGVSTAFTGVDWSTSGWTGEALKLINGARATVQYAPFFQDGMMSTGVKKQGRTIEFTVKIGNVIDESRAIVSCMGDGRGLRIQGSEISFLTGETITYVNEDDEEKEREVKMSTHYVAGTRMKVALVIDSMDERRVMHLYIDGNRVAADLYGQNYSFQHGGYLTFDSTAADIEVESVRLYNRALSDDEELGNHIYDSTEGTKMVEMFNDNDVLDERGQVSMTALRERGKGIIRIIHENTDPVRYGEGPLNDIFGTNNKSKDFTADVYYYSPLGPEYDFVCRGCNIRIQGTSSTKYPSKNIRIYLGKGPNNSTPALMGGAAVKSGNKYQLRPGAIAMNLFTAKADYSDSSMSLNTGGAKLFNDILKELGLLTPPQRRQAENGMNGTNGITVRAAIDGVPVDIFAAESVEGADTYYGQYNLNNEKAKSGKLFGMEGVDGYTPALPLALESLNNTAAGCLFQSEGADVAETAEWLGSADEGATKTHFDVAFEINYAAGSGRQDGDIKWAGLTGAEQEAVARVMAFVHRCVPAGADPADISTWASEEFTEHVAEYFDVDYLLTYYLWTEFFVSVDQRAKNIMWRTWDGQKWYPTYYDGDTQRGKRNDSFMVYTPETERDTWDEQADKWAFEGHDSWLWNLCLANLQTRLAQCAERLREKLTVKRVLDMLLVEQSGNWSDRVFNKSGELKYITPAVQTIYGKTWPFIYGLQGADKQHSEWFIRQRWSLLDSKYGMGDYTSDNIDCSMARAASDPADVIRITGTKTYSYGYGTNNQPKLYTTGIVQAGATAAVPVTGAFTVNDPLRIYGASRIRMLDLSGASGHLKNGFDVGGCEALETLDMHVPTGGSASTGWWLANLDKCTLLRVLDLRGQSGATTESGSLSLNLEKLTRLETLDLRGTSVTTLYIQPGAAVSTLWLPDTLQALTLDTLPALGSGLHVGSLAQVRSLAVTGCPSVNTQTVVQQWLSQAVNPQSLTLDGVNWTLTSQQLLSDIVTRVGTVSLSGRIHIDGAVSLAVVERCKELFGVDCLSPGGSVHITFTDEIILDDETQNPPLFAKCKAGNLCANEHYMTRTEAAAVTESTLYYANFKGNLTVETADEFRYFTGVTAMPGDFFNMYGTAESARCLRTITIPTNVGQLRERFLYGCVRLERITFLPMRAPSFYLSDHFFDVGKAVTGQKIMEIPRGSTGYNNNTGNWAKLASYTITYID